MRIPPPGTFTVDASLKKVFSGADAAPDWRMVWLQSTVPILVRLEWSALDGDGFNVQLHVSAATQVCVRARTLIISAKAVNGTGQLSVGIGNGTYAVSRNYFEVVGEGPDAVDVPTPAYSQRVRLDAGDPTRADQYNLTMLDASSDIRAVVAANDQPDGGVWMGASKVQRVAAPDGGKWRLVYELTI